jgi:hypothetical protein
MLDAPQLVTLAAVPLNFTVLLPWDEPNAVPVIVTDAPTAPDVIERLVIAGVTIKFTPLLATPDTVTTTLPVVTALGTVTTMVVQFQEVQLAEVTVKHDGAG